MPRDPEPTWMESLANRRPPYFWWLLILLLCSCFAILSWSLCISIFSQPELPKNYEILRKLGRLPTHKAYTSQNAPKHPAFSPPQVRKSYLDFTESELQRLNRSLLRSYLTNFQTNTFCSYIEGEFRVVATRKLTSNDIINQGFVIQLRAYTQLDEYSDPAPYPLIVELIIPTPYADSHTGYHPGDPIELSITPHFASLLHVTKQTQEDDDTLVIATAVSLSSKLRPPHAGPYDLRPPEELNLEADYPLFQNQSNP